MSFPDDIRDLHPNPGEKYNLIAILLIVYIKDYLLNNEISKIEGSKCVGHRKERNNLQQSFRATRAITPEGTYKSTVQPPQELQQYYVNNFKAQNILWLESALFVVAYFLVIQEEDLEHDFYYFS
ncbi:nucleoporin [Gigaspora margarita]|uniref:Nucleoporin n=1 Tax=Gigaspora margarita TaxID=4874 RepID=A0A8H3X0L5_GIGMA|nr:nucleoporin [Gigaspora margarita]